VDQTTQLRAPSAGPVRLALAVQVGEDEHVLQQGDSMYFDASAPHAYARRTGRTCTAIVVTSS